MANHRSVSHLDVFLRLRALSFALKSIEAKTKAPFMPTLLAASPLVYHARSLAFAFVSTNFRATETLP